MSLLAAVYVHILETEIEIELEFDQSRQSLLNLIG